MVFIGQWFACVKSSDYLWVFSDLIGCLNALTLLSHYSLYFWIWRISVCLFNIHWSLFLEFSCGFFYRLHFSSKICCLHRVTAFVFEFYYFLLMNVHTSCSILRFLAWWIGLMPQRMCRVVEHLDLGVFLEYLMCLYLLRFVFLAVLRRSSLCFRIELGEPWT